jgi:hypothetical protein
MLLSNLDTRISIHDWFDKLTMITSFATAMHHPVHGTDKR